MAFPVPNLLRMSRVFPMVLLLACGVPEGRRPLALVPTGWIHFSQGRLDLDHPPEWTVVTRPLGDDSLEIFLSETRAGQERCILAIHFGMELRFPSMERMQPYAKQAYNTLVGGARTRRIDPPESELPGSSEGILELGGTGPFHLAHFRYMGLDAPTRQAAEQVLASLRNQAPRP